MYLVDPVDAPQCNIDKNAMISPVIIAYFWNHCFSTWVSSLFHCEAHLSATAYFISQLFFV